MSAGKGLGVSRGGCAENYRTTTHALSLFAGIAGKEGDILLLWLRFEVGYGKRNVR
jgi:hypothetical protein